MRAFFAFLLISASGFSVDSHLLLYPQTGEVLCHSDASLNDLPSQYKAAVVQELIKPRLGKVGKKNKELEKALLALEDLKHKELSGEEFEEAKAKALKKIEELQSVSFPSVLNVDDQEIWKEIEELQIAFVDHDGSKKILSQRQAELFLQFRLNSYATLEPSQFEDEDLDDPFLTPIESPNIADGDIKTFSDLPLHEWEKQIISYIITSMAEKNVFQLLLEKYDLEKKGKKINPVHPLRFLGHACSDPKLKKGIRSFRKNPFKWDGFIHGSSTKGIAHRLEEEAKKDNLLHFVPEFSLLVGADTDEVLRHLNQGDYEGLITYLISI
jgi:hypothetical protein